jgi:hypothetical protein
VVRRQRPRRNSIRNRPLAEGELPALTQLERFSELSVRQWRNSAKNLTDLQSALFFGLELERQRHSPALIDAIRTNLAPGRPFERWARIVDYRYAFAPLSVAGSVKSAGGRFNIGASLNPVTFPPFPALYVAENYSTAFMERFGFDPTANYSTLAPEEIALRSPGSFAHVSLRGQLELVLDIREIQSLQAMATVIRRFALPDRVRRLARKIGMRSPPSIVRSAAALQRQLMHRDWRTLPMQFDLPSNSQIFGRIAAAAGTHGILYSSVRQVGGACLALFTQNWCGSTSFVEVMDGTPSAARLTRVDGETRQFF